LAIGTDRTTLWHALAARLEGKKGAFWASQGVFRVSDRISCSGRADPNPVAFRGVSGPFFAQICAESAWFGPYKPIGPHFGMS
jgi:hypothetical protein